MKRIASLPVAIALAIATLTSVTLSADAATTPGRLCSPTWDYALDTWRIDPDALVVDGSEVTNKWHIDDVYIPGSPDASADLRASVDIQIDDGPILTEDVFQTANQLTNRKLRISNLKDGRHQITSKLYQTLNDPVLPSINLGYISSCFAIPSHSSISRWNDLEAIPTH